MKPIVCDAPGCRRGIVGRGGDNWGRGCSYCEGLRTLSLRRTAKLLNINENTLRAFFHPDHKPRATTCARIIDAVMKILEPEVDGRQLRIHGS